MSAIQLAIYNPNGEPFSREVEGKIYGAWAAHESVSDLGYRVTFLRFGLAVPYDFLSGSGAYEAAKEINALRDDWADLSMEEIKAEAAAAIMGICETKAGERADGPKGKPIPISEIPPKQSAAA